MSSEHEAPDSDLGPQENLAAPGSTERLAQAIGPHELRCALLALLVPRGSRRTLAAWEAQTQTEASATPFAFQLRDEAMALPPAARLPWFERLLVRMAGQPLTQRQALLESTRRIVSARGTVQPLDTLHWLVMRRRLGEKAWARPPGSADVDLSRLPGTDVHAIARYSAFLSRMIPAGSPDGAAGAAWYALVMKPWTGRADVPAQQPLPDTDAVVHALHQVAALPWMQRPVLVREWLGAALQQSADPVRSGLGDLSADALRLSCTLLDSPLPPELSRHYIET
jgi:hypothetical protein